jgi:hypothetical protein
MLVSEVASTSVSCARAAPSGSTPVTERRASRPDTGPTARRASTRPERDDSATTSEASACSSPPSHAEATYRVPDGWSPPPGRRTDTVCVSSAVPPAPPANSWLPAPDRATAGNLRVPYRTTVGRPRTTCQPGIVTASQPCPENAPASAPELSSRFAPAGTPSGAPADRADAEPPATTSPAAKDRRNARRRRGIS